MAYCHLRQFFLHFILMTNGKGGCTVRPSPMQNFQVIYYHEEQIDLLAVFSEQDNSKHIMLCLVDLVLILIQEHCNSLQCCIMQ
jgi:hypothetical protein